MNINLSKLLKNEIIPVVHQPSLREQLKQYGVLQYTKYNDGGVHFNLLDCKDDADLEAVKQVILNHDAEAGELEEYNKKLIEQREARYRKEIDPKVIEKIRLAYPDLFIEENNQVAHIKNSLPKKVK
jgi:hypothetical protein